MAIVGSVRFTDFFVGPILLVPSSHQSTGHRSTLDHHHRHSPGYSLDRGHTHVARASRDAPRGAPASAPGGAHDAALLSSDIGGPPHAALPASLGPLRV